tara:strand:- start:156 stop:1331 length:1176 start_codon:yes stop_codon:yes gene_type:complete
MVWTKSYVAPPPTQDHKKLNSLAFQFGVGVSTPSWSSRSIYFQQSVSNGRKIEARINAVGGGVSNMEELVWKEGEPARLAEEKRIADEKETARLAEIERLRLKVIDDKFWKDRKDLQDNYLKYQTTQKNLTELLIENSQDLESFYTIENTSSIEFTYLMRSENLEKENEWYTWGLKNVKGLRNANQYLNFMDITKYQKNATAFWYLGFLKYQNTINKGTLSQIFERKDTIQSMEKMLKSWEEKRRIEIPQAIENKRLFEMELQENKRLSNLEIKRLSDLEDKRLEDIRLKKLASDKLLLQEIRFSGYQVGESRMLELLNQDYTELENFYEIDESSKVESIPSIDSIESIPSIESIEGIDSMSKQIPLETVTPVLAVLGIGLVSYYLLKGKK